MEEEEAGHDSFFSSINSFTRPYSSYNSTCHTNIKYHREIPKPKVAIKILILYLFTQELWFRTLDHRDWVDLLHSRQLNDIIVMEIKFRLVHRWITVHFFLCKILILLFL